MPLTIRSKSAKVIVTVWRVLWNYSISVMYQLIREDFINCGKSPIEYTICTEVLWNFKNSQVTAFNVLKSQFALVTSSNQCKSYFWQLSWNTNKLLLTKDMVWGNYDILSHSLDILKQMPLLCNTPILILTITQ